MKNIILCVVMLLVSDFKIIAQQTDCIKLVEKSVPSFVMKSFKPTDQQKEITKNKIENIKYCIAQTKDTEKEDLSKLYLHLANMLFFVDSTKQNEIVQHVSRSFRLDTIGFCKTYVSVQANYTPSITKAFEKYFIDLLDHPAIDKIKKYCLSNFEVPKRVVEEDKYANANYRKALDSIATLDQKYRDGSSTDLPDEQDILDSKNRILIDSLFAKYGFPTKPQVGKGTKTVFHVLLHSKDCDWSKKWIELFIQNASETGLSENEIAWFFKRFFDPAEGFCNQGKNGQRFIAYLLKKYSKAAARKAGYLEFYPELTSSFSICETSYDIFHELRIFTKKYKVDNNAIKKHLNCLLNEVDSQEFTPAVEAHIYNEIAQDYSLLGQRELAKKYIDKLAASDLDLLKVLFEKYNQDHSKASIYKPYYLNDFREYLETNYGISVR